MGVYIASLMEASGGHIAVLCTGRERPFYADPSRDIEASI
jgi:hypothetical protein